MLFFLGSIKIISKTKMKNIGVILCGCGSMDGSEIHEATFALAAIDELSANYKCFALDKPQARVINFLTGEAVDEKRNQLQEAARIARGQIQNISEIKVQELNALILPGGFGTAFNLCNFATEGAKAQVEPEIAEIIKAFYKAQKPIGAICIAPALLALVLGNDINPTLTAGNAEDPAGRIFTELGCNVVPCETTDCVIDEKNKIVTTPAYMNAKCISDTRKGIYKLVENVLRIS